MPSCRKEQRSNHVAGPDAARSARASVGGGLVGLPPAVVADAQLVVSELVTNAVLHSGLRSGQPIGLALGCEGQHLRIEVDDRCGFHARGDPSAGSPRGGRGLRIVAALAERWEAEGGRVTAWIRCPRPAGAAHARTHQQPRRATVSPRRGGDPAAT